MNNSTDLKYNNKFHFFEELYFFIILIYAGMAIPFTKSMMYYNDVPLGFLLPIGLTIILIFRNKVSFANKNFLYILLGLSVFTVLQIIKYGKFELTLAFFVFYDIIIAYILIKVFRIYIFSLYEKYMVILSLISLIAWSLYLLMPNVISSIMTTFDVSNSSQATIKANIFIFSLTNDELYLNEGYTISRNSGFSWEPGRYAAMLVFAIFFNLVRTRFSFKKNYGLVVLLIALFSTQSTTGISALLAILAIYLYNLRKTNHKYLLLLISVPLVVFLLNLPYMMNKINALSNTKVTRSKIETDLVYFDKKTYVPQRFDGLAFEWMNIINDPILGYGFNEDDNFVRKTISSNIGLSNGVFKIIAKFGTLLGIIFYIILYLSSKKMSELFSYRGTIFFMLIYIILSVSYDFTTIPMYLSFLLFPLFLQDSRQFQIYNGVNPL
jgi:hypothetical protein